MKKGRKLILVRTDLMEEAAKITLKEGRTLFSLTNEIFEKAIEAYKMHVTLDEALEFYKMINLGRSLGHVVVPCDVFSYMTTELYATKHEELLEKWYEIGLWNGHYLSIKFQKQDLIKVVRSFMKANLWNLDDFSLDVSENRVNVKCLSRNLTSECTEVLAKFLEGMFSSLGYTLKSNTCLHGIIMLELESEEEKETDHELVLDVKS